MVRNCESTRAWKSGSNPCSGVTTGGCVISALVLKPVLAESGVRLPPTIAKLVPSGFAGRQLVGPFLTVSANLVLARLLTKTPSALQARNVA